MISVIIPVFNAEKFLGQCMESVLTQDFSDFEVIMVDDGSTDRTPALTDAYAAADSRVQVIHTVNRGQAAARNTALAVARGEWVVFVDADDCLMPGALRRMLSTVEDAGVAQVGMFRWRTGGEYNPVMQSMEPMKTNVAVISGVEAASMVMYRYKGQEPAPWAKIFSHQLFDGIRFTEGIIYEDVDIMHRLLVEAGKVVLSEDCVYFYRLHESSTMGTWSRKRLDVLDVTDRMERWASELYPQLLPAARDRRFSAYFNIFLLSSRHGLTDVALRCWPVIKKYRREVVFSRQSRFKNKIGALLSLAGRRVTALFSGF